MPDRWNVSPELLEDVKNYLDITWEDEGTDRKLRGLIAGGMAYLDDKAGEAIDYGADGYGRSLLMDYVRYGRDGALDVFENNYRHLLLAMQNNRRVRDYAAEAVPGGE